MCECVYVYVHDISLAAFVCALHVCVIVRMPHLEHLLYVILMFCVNNAVHVPLQHFDQVPREDTHIVSPLTSSYIAHSFSHWIWQTQMRQCSVLA